MRHLLVGLLALAVLAVIPAAAQAAGTYTYHACRTPSGSPAFVAPDWHFSAYNGGVDHAYSSCYKGGYLKLWMAAGKQHAARDNAEVVFGAPQGTVITAYKLWRAVRLGSWYNWRYYERTTSGALIARESCFGVHGCSSRGTFATPLASSNQVSASGRDDVTGLTLYLTCGRHDTSSDPCPAQSPAAELRLYRADITLRDNAFPVIQSPPNGPLVDQKRRLSGVQPVTVSATDVGGGVYQATIVVDGKRLQTTTLDTNGGHCVAPFRYAVPCRSGVNATVPFDTARLRDGAHRLSVLVSDAAGNESTAGSFTIHTANASCNPNPRVKALKMSVGVGRHHRRRVTARYGRRLRIRGRLRAADGRPLAGAHLCVASRENAAKQPLKAAGTLTTNSRGGFSYRVRRGPSRRFYFVDRVPGGAVARSVLVRVRARASLRASRHSLRTGDTLTLSGRVRGGHVPRDGLLVLFQAPRAGGWQTFGTIRANRKGRFRFRYKFTRTQGVQVYRLRARIPSQQAYPFAPGNTRPVRVHVTG